MELKLKDIKALVNERGQYLVRLPARTAKRTIAALERDDYGVQLSCRTLDGYELWQVFGDRLY
jgi:hypothetical protein